MYYNSQQENNHKIYLAAQHYLFEL